MSSQKAMINTMMFYHWDETLFDGLQVPTGIVKNDVVASILLESSDFPVIITDLGTLKFSIGLWSRHRLPIWQHLEDTTHYQYNPIENYDRREEESYTLNKEGSGTSRNDGRPDTLTYNLQSSETGNTTNSGSDIVTNGGSDVVTNGGTDVITRDLDSSTNSSQNETRDKRGTDTTTESVSAFNESGYSDHTKTDTDYNSGEDVNTTKIDTLATDEDVTTTYGKTETTAHGKTETTAHGAIIDTTGTGSKTGTETRTNLSGVEHTDESTDSFTAEKYIHGNIGVTTTQDMIKLEREIAEFDIVDFIVHDYIKEFCIMVY